MERRKKKTSSNPGTTSALPRHFQTHNFQGPGTRIPKGEPPWVWVLAYVMLSKTVRSTLCEQGPRAGATLMDCYTKSGCVTKSVSRPWAAARGPEKVGLSRAQRRQKVPWLILRLSCTIPVLQGTQNTKHLKVFTPYPCQAQILFGPKIWWRPPPFFALRTAPIKQRLRGSFSLSLFQAVPRQIRP